jgi:beta-glucanase (GH16 family)
MSFPSKQHLLYLSLILLPYFTRAQHTDEYHKPGFRLIFYDDFNDPDLDKTKWLTSFTWGQCLPGSLAYFTADANYKIRDGKISLTAKKESINAFYGYSDSNGIKKPVYQKFSYTSSVITTKQTFKYGYYECRFKVPHGSGFNAAFWLFGDQNSEIDVFEIIGSKPAEVQTTLHWREKDYKNSKTQWFEHTKVQPPFDTAFHTMGVLWTTNNLTWYLDGKAMKSRKKSVRVWKRHIPAVELNLILNLGVGIIDPAPDVLTPFPAHFVIDYVKAYSLESPDELQIISQKNIKIKQNDSFKVEFKNLVVVYQSNLYPRGYKLNILPGAYYHVENNQIIPFKGFRGKLLIPVVIDDGIRKSNIYNLEVTVDDITKSEKLNDPVVEIIYPPGNMEIIVKYNGDQSGRISFSRMEFIDNHEKLLYKFDPLEPGCIRITRNVLPAGLYYLKFVNGNDAYIEKVEFK